MPGPVGRDTGIHQSHLYRDFHMIVNQSIAVHALPMHMLSSLSADGILLPKYMKSCVGVMKEKKKMNRIK